MQILVDYDNVPGAITRKGIRFLADLLQSQLLAAQASKFPGDLRLDFRFYGGWQTLSSRSPNARQVLADTQSDFPTILFDRTASRRITMNGTLAESLLILPHQVLPHTYREKSEPPRLKCSTSQSLGCNDPACMANELNSLFRNRQCPRSGCGKPIEDLLSRREQKLVDTMLVADIIHLAHQHEQIICVVSSDDDIWPGMLSAMNAGAEVIHVTTKYPSTAASYLGALKARYSTFQL
jgi:hypothetical protein